MTMTTTSRRGRIDLAHHHPHVLRTAPGGWTWECECGGAAARSLAIRLTWHQAVAGALTHSASIRP